MVYVAGIDFYWDVKGKALEMLDNRNVEISPVVANCRMNRLRQAVGSNSYEEELGFSPIEQLIARQRHGHSTAWLDLCCGSGRALLQVADTVRKEGLANHVRLVGVDLVDMFDENRRKFPEVRLIPASLHEWSTDERFDLITCVHGLHYVGDKLGLIERAIGWLDEGGLFSANIDLSNIRGVAGKSLGRSLTRRLRENNIEYDSRYRRVTCLGHRPIALGYRYLGCRDDAGPNHTGQDAVDSYYAEA